MKVYLGPVGSLRSAKSLLPASGRKTSEATKELRRETILSSGKKVVDLIATKKVFSFNYDMITGPDLDVWLNYIGSATWELEIERRDGSFDKYQVRFTDETQYDYFRTVGEWYLQNAAFALEEI